MHFPASLFLRCVPPVTIGQSRRSISKTHIPPTYLAQLQPDYSKLVKVANTANTNLVKPLPVSDPSLYSDDAKAVKAGGGYVRIGRETVEFVN